MITKYKLLNKDLTTFNGCKWSINEWKETNGKGELCTSSWLHAYHHPLLAMFLNPIHGNFSDPVLYIVECDGNYLDDKGLKCGFTRMRLLHEIDLPKVKSEQRIRFGIGCALEVYKDEDFVGWANEWLSGKDLSAASARTIAAAAYYAAADAADYAAYAAANANAAYYAANAAAADAADYAAYADAADAVAYAAYAADAVAYAATYAARAAQISNFDLIKIAEWALSV